MKIASQFMVLRPWFQVIYFYTLQLRGHVFCYPLDARDEQDEIYVKESMVFDCVS